jgi:hypothetical protein
VTFHDLAHPRWIRRCRAADGYGHFPEEFGPENSWRENTKHFRNRLRLVDEPVDNTSRDEKIISWPDLDTLAGDRPSDDALKAVDRFFPITVVVRDRHMGVRRDHHLKHIKSAAGVILGAQKPQLHCANLDEFSHCRAFPCATEKIAGRPQLVRTELSEEAYGRAMEMSIRAMMSEKGQNRKP